MKNFLNRYNYAAKHFTEGERNKIWRSLNNDSDAMYQLNYARNIMNSVLDIPPQDLVNEDVIDVEKALGELEITIKRIHTLPELFTFEDSVRNHFMQVYLDVEQYLNKLYQRKISR